MLVRGAMLGREANETRRATSSSSLSELINVELRLRGAMLLRENTLLRLAPKEVPKALLCLPIALPGLEVREPAADAEGANERDGMMLLRPRNVGSSSSDDELMASTVF